MAKKINCEACGTRWNCLTAELQNGVYSCGCGWSITESSIVAKEG